MEETIISNPAEFEAKLKTLAAGGAKNTHIVTDFDRTLSKAFCDGKKVNTLIAQLRYGNYLTQDYPKKAFALYEKYRPIEIDPRILFEEKKMQEWWSRHCALIAKSGLTKELIKKIVLEKNVPFREGALEFFDTTHAKRMPLLILSAGLGDFINEMLSEEGKNYPNIHTISNFFKFDNNGIATGYQSQIIHSLNKNEAEVKNTPHYAAIKERKNVLLLGDSLDDLQMTEGIEYDEILKIGFLNENIEEQMPAFKKAFDAIITNDGSMNFVNKLLEEIH